MKKPPMHLAPGARKSFNYISYHYMKTVVLRHKAMATFVLWGMISPSLIFIFCLQLHVCGLKPRRVRHGACSFHLQ